MADDKFVVFKNKKGTLDIIKLKHPNIEDRDQLIFCNPGELEGLYTAIKNYLGVNASVTQEAPKSAPSEPQGRAWCEKQNKRITKVEKLSKGNEVRITAIEEEIFRKKGSFRTTTNPEGVQDGISNNMQRV